MFMFLLFSCDVEIPDVMFENNGAGKIWIGGKQTEAFEQEENQDSQENEFSESSVDTAIHQENSDTENECTEDACTEDQQAHDSGMDNF